MSKGLEVRREDRLRAAAFFHEALGSDVDPVELEPELVVLKIDAVARIYSVEVDSSVGSAAFLIYQYQLDATTSTGKTGHDTFRTDLETLELAAERETPGPRILAHANADAEGYILATTPATYRALMGETAIQGITASEQDLLPAGNPVDTRNQSADELLRLLRLSNEQAKRWFAAVRSEGKMGNAADDLEFSQEESALALFLIDESSIQDLLRLLSVMVSAAQRPSGSQFPEA
ncbi:MAG: hypothetical protein ACRDHN_05125 [Thermomicrobiales bacterium]